MISAAVFLLELIATSGPVYRGTDRNLRVDIPRIEISVEIDGEFAEAVWERAARLTGFSQYAPDEEIGITGDQEF
jgi:hypothetical protein